MPPEALIDPEKPVEPDECVGQFVPVETPRRLIGGFALLAMAIVGFAAAWHWTPLGRCAQSESAHTSGPTYRCLGARAARDRASLRADRSDIRGDHAADYIHGSGV